MLALQELLLQPFRVFVIREGEEARVVETGGELVEMELIRGKNKCSAKGVGMRSNGSKPPPPPPPR